MMMKIKGLNLKFAKYVKGFSEVFRKHFNSEPTMGVLVFNGWLSVKDKKLINFEKTVVNMLSI